MSVCNPSPTIATRSRFVAARPNHERASSKAGVNGLPNRSHRTPVSASMRNAQ